MKIEIKMLFSSFIFAAGIGSLIVFSSPPDLESAENSVYRANLKSSESRASRRLSAIMLDDVKSDLAFTSQVRKDLESKLSLSQVELAQNLETFESDINKKLGTMRIKGIKIPRLLRINLRQRIAISYYIGIEPSNVSILDLQTAKISTQEWSRITSFAASNDFKLLLSKNRLTPHSIREYAFNR